MRPCSSWYGYNLELFGQRWVKATLRSLYLIMAILKPICNMVKYSSFEHTLFLIFKCWYVVNEHFFLNGFLGFFWGINQLCKVVIVSYLVVLDLFSGYPIYCQYLKRILLTASYFWARIIFGEIKKGKQWKNFTEQFRKAFNWIGNSERSRKIEMMNERRQKWWE